MSQIAGLDGREWPPDRLDYLRKNYLADAQDIEATLYNNDCDKLSEKSASIISAVPEKSTTVT